ncbi:MAG: autotransporter-associated beta strand repeat-containing protein, partial [Planctomycetota bacterium]|nr:autotransporter-associated beta strand repeat-containing protein [Planctomycetota bacterium]
MSRNGPASAFLLAALLSAIGFLPAAPALALNSTWVGGNGNWSDSLQWNNGVPDGVGDIARLNDSIGAPGTVTIDGGVSRTVGQLDLVSLTSSGYTLTGTGLNLDIPIPGGSALVRALGNGVTHTISAPISLLDSVLFDVSSAATLQISGNIDSASSGTGITKTGVGLLILTGANTYTGGTTINGGILRVNADANLGTRPPPPTTNITLGGGTLQYGASFDLDLNRNIVLNAAGGTIDTNGYNVTIGSAVSGTGGLTKSGVGTLTLTGTNTYQSGTTINVGILKVSADGNLGTAPTSDATNITFGGGTLQFGGAFSVASTRSITLNAAGGKFDTNGYNVAIASHITGSGGLTKAGPGMLTLTGGNSYGGAVIQAGELRGNTASLTGPMTVNGGTLTFDQPGDDAFGNIIGGAGAVTKMGLGKLTLTNVFNSYAGGTTINAGILKVSSNSNLGTAPASPATNLTFGGGTLQYGASFDLDLNRNIVLNAAGGTVDTNGYLLKIGSAISGTGGLTKTGDGRLYLTGANTYQGGTTINAGILKVDSDGNLGAPAANVTLNGGTLAFNASADLASTRGITLNSAGSTIDTSIFNITVASSIGGPGDLTKAGTGTLALTGSNTYQGGTVINDGVLKVSSDGALGTAPASPATNIILNTTFGGTTLQFGASFNLSPNRSIVLNATYSVVDTNGYNATIGSAISGPGGLTKKFGAGTLTVTGNNSYSGGTVAAAGALRAVDGIGLPSGSNLVFDGGGVLEGIGATNFTRSLGTTGASTVQWTTSGGFSASGGKMTVALGDPVNPPMLTWASGQFVPSGAALVFGSPTADSETEFRNPINLGSATRTVTVNDNPAVATDFATLSGVLSGGGAGSDFLALTKNGPGTLVLSGTNTYMGITTIAAGALRATDGVGLPSDSKLVLNGGVLEGIVATTFDRPVQWTGSGGFSAFSGKMTVALLGGTQQPVALTWGSGPFVPTGSALMFGSPTADSETEFKNPINLLGAIRTVTVTDNPSSANDFATLSGVLSSSPSGGGLTKDGSGTLVLTGNNTYTGPTTISAGVLRASDGVGLPSAGGLVLSGGVLEGMGVTTFIRDFGAGIQWTGSGGFSASGGKMTVAIGGTGSPTPLTWGSGGFVPSGSALVFGSTTADNETEFKNSIDFAGAARTITVNDNPTTTADFATISGVLSNGSLAKNGTGTLVLSRANTYGNGTTVSQGALLVSNTYGSGTGTGAVTVGASTLGGT